MAVWYTQPGLYNLIRSLCILPAHAVACMRVEAIRTVLPCEVLHGALPFCNLRMGCLGGSSAGSMSHAGARTTTSQQTFLVMRDVRYCAVAISREEVSSWVSPFQAEHCTTWPLAASGDGISAPLLQSMPLCLLPED